MLLSASNPVFVTYVIACLVLVVHLIFLWAWSGVVRTRTKTTVNPEDAAQWGAALEAADPPDVARVMRVYANALSTCVPFFALGLLWTALGGGSRFAEITFGAFVAARLLYAVVYLRGVQPWRSIIYTASMIAVGALIVDIIRLLLRR